MGADVAISYRTHRDWAGAVIDATGGEGVDLAIVTGGAGTLPSSIRCARTGGSVAVLGTLTGLTATIDTGSVLTRWITMRGIYVGSRADFDDLIRFVEEHQLEPMIDRVFVFAEVPDAFRHMESGQHFGKIVVSVNP